MSVPSAAPGARARALPNVWGRPLMTALELWPLERTVHLERMMTACNNVEPIRTYMLIQAKFHNFSFLAIEYDEFLMRLTMHLKDWRVGYDLFHLINNLYSLFRYF